MDTRISRLLLLRSYYLVPNKTANGTETFSTHPKSNPVSHFLRNFLLSSLRSESPAWYIVQGVYVGRFVTTTIFYFLCVSDIEELVH